MGIGKSGKGGPGKSGKRLPFGYLPYDDVDDNDVTGLDFDLAKTARAGETALNSWDLMRGSSARATRGEGVRNVPQQYKLHRELVTLPVPQSKSSSSSSADIDIIGGGLDTKQVMYC